MRGRERLMHGALLLCRLFGDSRKVRAVGKCRAREVTLVLLGAQEVVRQLEIKDIRADGKSRLRIALCIPEYDGTLRKHSAYGGKLRRVCAQHAPLRPVGKGEYVDLHKGRRAAEYRADGNLLRRAQRCEVGNGKRLCIEVYLCSGCSLLSEE